jgi:hypothetical protein
MLNPPALLGSSPKGVPPPARPLPCPRCFGLMLGPACRRCAQPGRVSATSSAPERAKEEETGL